MTALDRLDALDAVDLAQLNETAELQTRVDRKYILPRAALPEVLAELPARTRVLAVEGEHSLRYASQYFDTPALDSYFGAVRGRRRRVKGRTRTYIASGGSFLEVKTRGARATTVKERMPVDGAVLDDDAVAYAADLLEDSGIPGAACLAAALEPVLVTRYRRVTLLLPGDADDGDPSRATIDIDLAWIGADGRALTLPRAAIVETKSGQRAGAFDRTLWRHRHRPASLSKYGTGMAALNPHLPANKWRRVLTRYFCDTSARPIAARRP